MIPRAAIGPILLISLLVLLAFWRTPSARPVLAPPSAVQVLAAPERSLAPGVPTPTAVPLAGQYTQATNLDIVIDDGLFDPDEEARVAAELERALAYVSERFGSGPSGRIRAYIGTEASCGLHGIAYTIDRTTQVFTCRDLPRVRAVNIMAHEFVHQLAQDRYGDRHLAADMILLEGTATWGAGAYWLGNAPNFAAFVRPLVADGSALPLATSYVGRPVADMNTLYYQWASFVEFLVEVYGRDRFDAIYVSGNSEPGSADYAGVYGKNLSELETEWRAWVLREP